jgi:predicted N-acetyltransferase YhbS
MAGMRLVTAEGPGLEQILDESHRIWSDGLSRRDYGRYNAMQLRTPWGGRHLRRMLLVDDNGEVLSSAKQYDLVVRLDGRSVRAMGIGAVFTPEASRGRGYARALLDRMIEKAAAVGAELALLFSEIDPDYYASAGFEPVPRRELTIRTLEGSRPGAPMILVRAGEERDLGAVAALARRMTEPYRFAVEQTDDYVRFGLTRKRLLAGLLPPDLLNVEFFIAEEGAGAVAFVILTVTPEDIILEMCGDRDPAGARVGAMLQVLRARTPSEVRPALLTFLPPRWLPPQLEIESSEEVREVLMVRPLRDGLLTRPLTERDILFWHGDMF